MCGYLVRTFREGDERSVVKLFNETYAEYGGFVPRTMEYWRWCCLERPDVERNGIILVFDGEQLCGYVVVGSSGNIWEFCVDGDREPVASILLHEAMKYLEGLGVSSVNVNVPLDEALARVLVKAGFAQVPVERMFASTLSSRALISELVAGESKKIAGLSDEEIAFKLERVPFGVKDSFSVKMLGGEVEVYDGLPRSPTIIVNADFGVFLSVLFGVLSPYRPLFGRKLKVKPFWKTRTVLKFLSSVCVRGPWFFPLSDFG